MTDEPIAQLTFAEGAIDGTLMARMVGELDLGFTPKTLICDELARSVRYGPKALERLAAVGSFRHAELIDTRDHAHEFSIGSLDGQAQQIVWRPERADVLVDAIESLAGLAGFNAAYLGHEGDVVAQSRSSTMPWEDVQDDLSRNWGRSVLVGGIWLWAAATMWFGPGAFLLLDRERLLALPVGEVTERGAVVRVDLFPADWYATDLAAVRERQQRFWEWMALPALEAAKAEIGAALSDPQLEIETGVFEHGGERRVTEWLDDAGRPTPRSRATRSRRAEHALDGTVLWRED